MRPLALLLAISLLTGCDIPPQTPTPETAAEELAQLGALAKSKHQQIHIEGGITGSEVSFKADYAPEKNTLDYQLTTPDQTEHIQVTEKEATRSTAEGTTQKVNRESFMPNGKDWPYGSRMVAPFLDAIDAYSATIHSFHITNTEAPKDRRRRVTKMVRAKTKPRPSPRSTPPRVQ